MSIGVTQLILIIIIGILLFGNIPKIFKDVGTGIQLFKKTVNKESKDLTEDSNESSVNQSSLASQEKSEVEKALGESREKSNTK